MLFSIHISIVCFWWILLKGLFKILKFSPYSSYLKNRSIVLQNDIKAITLHIKEILLLCLFFITMIFIYSVIGFLQFDMQAPQSNELKIIFTSVLNRGLRSTKNFDSLFKFPDVGKIKIKSIILIKKYFF